MLKIVEYCMVDRFDPNGLGESINEMLKDGWELYGNHTTVMYQEDLCIYSQAMVRREQDGQ